MDIVSDVIWPERVENKMSETLLEVRNLKKYFKTPGGMLHAVDDVSFRIQRGRTLGVVGESGCGKSTLGRTLLCLNEPTAGEILFQGTDIAKLGKKQMKAVRPKMQMIFQDPYSSLNGRMTIRQLIAEPLIVNKLCKKRQEVDNRVDEIMEIVGLAPRLAAAYPHELDGGRRQRIGIARTLILNPEFVVCDEPVSALDVSIQAQILNLLMDLQEDRNLTYIFITHDLGVVSEICDKIIVMYAGKVVEEGMSRQIFYERCHPYTEGLLASVPKLDSDVSEKLKPIKGNPPDMSAVKPGCAFASRCSCAMKICVREEPPEYELDETHKASCWQVIKKAMQNT